jgi:U3 small nucleolar ribonucleoprotein protein LCP5
VVDCLQVRKGQLPTGDGIGYLEAKHHLLLGYCQDLVYYLLRKAKGLSVDGHPVVRSLVEIRLFLEKVCVLMLPDPSSIC